jgi:hypothetical protein
LCDITQPGGYCTIFNCEPGDCPEESSCVIFGVAPSTLEGCEDPHGVTPYQRSFCLKTCDNDGDCRSGYECANFADPANPWGAVVADGSGKVCAVPYSGVPITSDIVPSTDVCTGESPTSSSGGAAGDGSSGENGGASGAANGESGGASGAANGENGGASGAVSSEPEGGTSSGLSGGGGQGGG